VHIILPDEFELPYKLAERALRRVSAKPHPTFDNYTKQGKLGAFLSELNFIEEALRMVLRLQREGSIQNLPQEFKIDSAP